MNETQVNGLLQVLEAQRNQALNVAANAEATNIALRQQIANLEQELQARAGSPGNEDVPK